MGGFADGSKRLGEGRIRSGRSGAGLSSGWERVSDGDGGLEARG